VWLVAGLLALAVLAVYANSLHAPFVFDDIPSILDNPTIRQLWPLSVPLSPPSEFGLTVCSRPLLNLSLALNFAAGGFDPFGYHLLNTLIHLAAALALFDLARRTMPHWRPATPPHHATLFAGTLAALWALHPLLTESVTYVIQRGESLTGLFALLTLYAYLRAADSARPWPWRALALLAACGAVATKEIGVIVPVLVVLYDRTFLASPERTDNRPRRLLQLALFASWLLLAWIVFAGGGRGGTAQLAASERWAYWCTQFQAVAHYLRLSFWPHPLIFEYGFQLEPGLVAVLPQALLVVALGAASLYAAWRRQPAGFLGCWFFIALAPASLTPNNIQVVVEHRMYLPLLAPLALLAGLAFARGGVRWLAPLAALALAAGGLTVARNHDYRTEIALWSDTVAKAPRSARAWSGLGAAWFITGDYARSLDCSRRAIDLDPTHPIPHMNVGLACEMLGRTTEAVEAFATTTRLNPAFTEAYRHLASCFIQLGRTAEAVEPLRHALELDPADPRKYALLGVLLAERGLPDKAAEAFRHALELNPRCELAEANWGTTLFQHDRPADAVPHFERSLALYPQQPDIEAQLATALLAVDRLPEALVHIGRAISLAPQRTDLRTDFGIELARAHHLPEAREQLAAAAAADPQSARARTNLANVLSELGEYEAACGLYEEALKLEPSNALAHFNLANALLHIRRPAEAHAHVAAAVRLDPSLPRARQLLDQMDRVLGPAQ
jgi:protein O-mannosyl-transferase